LPRPSVPNCTTRSVADAMQRKPLPNRTKMPAFWAFGICRFQVKRIGKNMTVLCQSRSYITRVWDVVLARSVATSTAYAKYRLKMIL
jgi:hypothetical protein